MSMRKNKGVNANMNFLFGGVLLFFVLVLIVGLFSFFTLQQFWHSDESVKVAGVTKRYDYSVAFDSSFKGKSYKLYLSNDYEEYDIWIRNVISKPKLSDGRTWTFWQYTNRGKLDGYNGKEKFIDLNVFNGSKEKFASFLQNRGYKNPAKEP